jgi:hypothetical protein
MTTKAICFSVAVVKAAHLKKLDPQAADLSRRHPPKEKGAQ